MKYSVIICYRDREEHLEILIPRLRKVLFSNAEIIVVEQNDDDRFLRGQLFNVGAKYARGDILVFHDVDHYPVDVTYNPIGAEVYLPIKRVVYVNNALEELPIQQVPSGYRHFRDSVDDDFFGGVEIFDRNAFHRINGFNSFYRGWGLEDADLRNRIEYFGLEAKRGDGKFYALQHQDSFPGLQDEDFKRNQKIFARWKDYVFSGLLTQTETTQITRGSIIVDGIDLWIKATNFAVVQNDSYIWPVTQKLGE